MDIFVGNLLFAATDVDLKKLFEGFGNIASVTVVMSKEKKVPKSRGFGFVQMPDEAQALAAIAALNGKEFMGRVLEVAQVRPKVETSVSDSGQPKIREQAEQRSRQEPEERKAEFRPVFRPGAYKGGRRTLSYMKRRGLTEIQQEKPRRRSQDNPMRWRKRTDQTNPWQKGPSKNRPWEKTEGGDRPWKKAEGEPKPWRKPEGGSKPWKKPAGDAKPWKKPAGDAKPWRRPEAGAKPWRRPEGGSKPWKKPAGDAKPWKKPAGDAKPWKKPEAGAKPWKKPEKSRFKGRKIPGGYKRGK